MKLRRFLGQYIVIDSHDLSDVITEYEIVNEKGKETLFIAFGRYDDRVKCFDVVETHIWSGVKRWRIDRVSIKGNYRGVTMQAVAVPYERIEDVQAVERKLEIKHENNRPFLDIIIHNLDDRAELVIKEGWNECKVTLKKNPDGTITAIQER